MKVKLLVVCLIVVAILVAAAPAGVSADPTPAWVQVNEDGFGDWRNMQIPALAVHEGYLYAGVWQLTDYETGIFGEQIWRSPDGNSWEKVHESATNGAAALVSYKGYIYAATWGYDGMVWRSDDGLLWEDVTNELAGIHLDTARFTVYKNALYISSYGPDGTGANIWVTINGTNWAPSIIEGMGDPMNYGAQAEAVFKGKLYWGVGNYEPRAQLWRTDGVTTEAVMTDGFGMNISSMSSLAVFGNYLYAGGGLWGNVQVWRTANGQDWVQVYSGQVNGEATALEVYGNELFLVVENWDTGLEVWSSSNGTDWSQLVSDGFGDINNGWSNWDFATVVFRDNLYVATSNYWSGGEIWKLCRTGCQ